MFLCHPFEENFEKFEIVSETLPNALTCIFPYDWCFPYLTNWAEAKLWLTIGLSLLENVENAEQ